MTLSHAIDRYDPRQLDALTREQIEALPVGAIRVDEHGVILFYSRAQGALANRTPTVVLGKNFFTDVAPCTVVPEFYGRFRHGVLTGDLDTSFEFVFDFDTEPIQVKITMRASEHPDEFWIVVDPIRHLARHDDRAAEQLIAAKFGEQSPMLSSASFDFSQCDREPIATCAAIQPFGALLVLDPATLRIDACSANSAMYLGMEPEVLLDAPLTRFLPEQDAGLRAALSAPASDAGLFSAMFRLDWPGSQMPLQVRAHAWREHVLLECELHGDMAMDARMREFNQAAFQRRLRDQREPAELCQTAVDVLRDLTGFERVVAYRFEPNSDGVVIAESIQADSWPSILGLRYPASDIPKQARALYCETPLRYAPSRDHADVALLSRRLDPDTIDIGIAQLRAHSPIHRNYHKRFEVNGSMSISLMHETQLWGLLIFHHRTPHPVTPFVRQRAIELAGSLSERLALLEERAQNRARQQGVEDIERMLARIDLKQPFPDAFLGKEALLRQLLSADIVQLYHHQRPLFAGQDCNLSAVQIQALLAFLHTREGAIWSTDCLSAEFEPAAVYPDLLAGVLVIFIDDLRHTCLVFGRRRIEYSVEWGGEPGSLPFVDDSGAQPLGWPNRTFQRWREERTHHSRPWTATQLAIAEELKTELLKCQMQQVIVSHATHFEHLAESLASQRDQLHRSREEMRHRALHDPLTGLPNRAHFRESLLGLIEQNWRDDEQFGVALLDIDHFKTINDTLGHDRGDILLSAVAQRIAAALPPPVLIARLGGDEFALLIPQAREGDACERITRLVDVLRDKIEVGDDRFAITASIGLTIGDGGSDPSELLKQADLALYRAKEDGRNCARMFDHSLQTQALKRLEIDHAILGRAPMLAIELVLQPQRPIRASEPPRRFEVLSRWRTDAGTLMMPGDFIPAAERNGLIRSVTGVVLRQTLRLLRSCLVQGHDDVVMSVNISASDLESQTFARRLIEDLHAVDVPPDMIEIEVTESMLLRMTPNVTESINILKRGGIGLALDDFGTGFSSMMHLHELPISVLKIDRAFIGGIENAQTAKLVAGIIAMAHSIGKTVVAEGIETDAQLKTLDSLGCDWGQGYLWSRPVAPEQALACLSRN